MDGLWGNVCLDLKHFIYLFLPVYSIDDCSDELGAPDDDIIFEDFARLRLKGAETEA